MIDTDSSYHSLITSAQSESSMDDSVPTESDSLLPTVSNASLKPSSYTSGSSGGKVLSLEANESTLFPIKLLRWTLYTVLACATAWWLLLPIRHAWHDMRQDASASDSASSSPRFDTSNPYRATQFISYTINTMGGSGKDGECEGRGVDPETGYCYLGNVTDLTADAWHRLEILEQVLQQLRDDDGDHGDDQNNETTIRINPDPSVLKIFILPEFYLRGPYGAYSTAQMLDSDDDSQAGLLIQLSKRLREIIVDDFFEHYLFVFGTVIFAQEMDHEPDHNWWENEVVDSTKLLYYNFSPIFKGGTGHDHYYVIFKNNMSVGDFLDRSKLPDPKHLMYYSNVEESQILQETLANRGIALIENNVLELDGIRFGVELCLDHMMGTLWASLQATSGGGSPELVDVQLISSAGMDIQSGPTPLVPGGVVYMSDGEASSAACIRPPNALKDGYAVDDDTYDPTQVCSVPPDGLHHISNYRLRHPTTKMENYSTFVLPESCMEQEDLEILRGYYSLYLPQGCASTLSKYGYHMSHASQPFYPPALEFYPTIDLPPLRAATKKKTNSDNNKKFPW